MKKNIVNFIGLFFLSCWVSFYASPQNNKYEWRDEVDLLKRIDKLPEYRTNDYVEQISSYDRTGGNDDGFSGKYSYIRQENGKLVIADLKGPGVINRIWTPTPTDDMLEFYFDGETNPRLSLKFSDLFSGKVYPFLKPVCGNELGGFYCYIPLLYKKSCKILYRGKKLEFIQIQYRNLPSKNVESFTGNFSDQERNLLATVNKIWENSFSKITNFAFGKSSNIQTESKTFIIKPGEEISFFEMENPGRIVGFEIDGGDSFEGIYKDVMLSSRWDNEKVAAIYAPLADFFGYAYGKSFMKSILMGKNGASNYCYLPMPFDKCAEMKLIYKKRNDVHQSPISIDTKVYYNSNQRDVKSEGKFYSSWKREKPKRGEYYSFLKTIGKGHYVGTIHQAQGLRPGMTLFFEGDDSTYVDGKMRIHGTGSEDYYNGGWYALLDRWDRANSLPLHGCLDYSLPMNRTGGYRFYLTDKLSFEKEIFHGIEHGPIGNDFPVEYTSVALYYASQPPQTCVEPTDEMRVVYLPTEHVFFPQLMEITPGSGIQIILDRGLMMKCFGYGTARIMLRDVPEGRYKLLINYSEKKNGADFQVWQRQKQLSSWISTQQNNESLKERVYIGDIQLTSQTNSVTFHVRQKDAGDQFELDLITLEKIN